tara:strand:- start:489 stop:680 length:192 start_codon:yes stop_codon:yes gene_type:complete
MKVGDRVTMSPMWKHDSATGSIIKITKDYVVVSWDNINGEWHYTHEQSARLEAANEILSVDKG